jgi:predicted Zn-dependent protease
MKNLNRIFLFVTLLFSISSEAFTLNSSSDSAYKGWDAKSLTFHFNPANCSADEASIRKAIKDAMDLWNNVPTSYMKLNLGADTSTTSAVAFAGDAPDEGIVIACDTAFNATTDAGESTLAVAAVSSSSTEHRAVYATIIMNSESGATGDISLMTQDQLAVTLAHEMGHVFGLGHSESTISLMYYQNLRSSLTLGQDDIDGITYLYPRNELSGEKPMGCATIESIPPGPPSIGGGMFLLFFFGFAWILTRPMGSSRA